MVDTDSWSRQKVARMLQNHYYAASALWQDEERQRRLLEVHGLDIERSKDDDNNDGHMDTKTLDSDRVDSNLDTPPQDSHFAPSTNPCELPLQCPTSSQLEQLIHESLSFEQRHLPKLYRKSASEHRAAFRAAIDQSPEDYCWIDTNAILTETSLWKD